MYDGLLCNISPTSTFQPCNARRILTVLPMSVEVGQNKFGDLEQHGWTPVNWLQAFVIVFFIICLLLKQLIWPFKE